MRPIRLAVTLMVSDAGAASNRWCAYSPKRSENCGYATLDQCRALVLGPYEAAYFNKRFNADSHSRSGSRSPAFASSMISSASVAIVGSLRSTNPSFPKAASNAVVSRDVFSPEPMIVFESKTIGHESPALG
jgi:hypothetical protein